MKFRIKTSEKKNRLVHLHVFFNIESWQSKNSDQTRSSDQPYQTCNPRILRNTQPNLFKLGNNWADEMFIEKNGSCPVKAQQL
jgi:hypothetical protein